MGDKAIEKINRNNEIENISVVRDRIKLVNELYKTILEPDKHYGKIPGTDKDTLYKPGAEKLTVLFKLVPKIDKEEITDLGKGHREYKLTIGLYHKNNGECWGQAVGSCSTMESKYRYRNKEEETGIQVDKSYWDLRNANNMNKYYEKYPDRKVYSTKKINNVWMFIKKEGKIENENIADVYNTVYKMAYKRAFVGAVIIATGVSDIFTQDLEENYSKDEEQKENKSEIRKEFEKLKDNDIEKNKKEIIELAKKLTNELQKSGKLKHFLELNSNKNLHYSEEEYLLDLQYLQSLGKEKNIAIDDNDIKEPKIFDGLETELENENFGDR